MMYVKNLNLSTVGPDEHPLSITDENGKTVVYTLTAAQLLMIAHQAVMGTWTHYVLTPRD